MVFGPIRRSKLALFFILIFERSIATRHSDWSLDFFWQQIICNSKFTVGRPSGCAASDNITTLTLSNPTRIIWNSLLQVNLFQKRLFLYQLTHNMTKDCSLNYEFSTWKFQAQNMLRTCCVHKLFFVFVLTFKTIYVHNIFSTCSELAIFMYWTRNSMNNLSSYCGLVDAKIRASDKDLPVEKTVFKKCTKFGLTISSGPLLYFNVFSACLRRWVY